MKPNTKGFLRFVASVLMVAALGLVSAVAATEALISIPVAAAPCENDACEHDPFGDYCYDNPGQHTYCVLEGTTCVTKLCAVE